MLSFSCMDLWSIGSDAQRVAETKEKTKKILSKQAVKIAKQAEEHERFITKVGDVFQYPLFCMDFVLALLIHVFIVLIVMLFYLFWGIIAFNYMDVWDKIIRDVFVLVVNQVTHLLSVLGFGAFCFILGARKLFLIHDNQEIALFDSV